MNVVYIAGPFRAATPWGIKLNVDRAEALALEVWKLGAVALCPHAMTRHYQDAAPDDVWLAGMLELLGRCDAVLLVEGWQRSTGALEERLRALDLGLPVFEHLHQLQAWLG